MYIYVVEKIIQHDNMVYALFESLKRHDIYVICLEV